MKTPRIVASCLVFVTTCVLSAGPLPAQTPPPTGGNSDPPPKALAWQATARNGVSTTWEANEPVTNAVTGAVTNVPHRYVEIASGLNYLDPATGQYQPSQDRIELAADGGAAALHGPAKLYVKPNLNTAGAITLVTASNRVFQTRPLGVFWYNAQSGQAELIAPVQDCVGELVPPNQVVFKSAFGPLADLRLAYTKSGIESDLVLVQAPTLPAGWDPQTTRLELWHDWTGAPTPGQKPRLLYRETDAALRSLMVDPDLTDHILDFGDLWFPTGAAYATDGSDAPASNTARAVRVPNLAREPGLVGVAKTWLTTPSANVLVEGVRWPDIQAKLQGLPAASAPILPAPALDRLAWLTQLPAPNTAAQAGPAITQAAADYHPAAVVLDYITLDGEGYGYTFASGTTYYIPSGFSVGPGGATFQPNACLKFGQNAGLLLYDGPVSFPASGAKVIFTSKDDNLYGDTIAGSTGNPAYAANPAIWMYYHTSANTIQNAQIRWAIDGINYDESSGVSVGPSLNASELENCQHGLNVNLPSDALYLSGDSYCNVGVPMYITSLGRLYGSLTIDCALNIDKSFQGMTGARTDDEFPPPADTDGAVGPNHFVEIVNQKIAVYDKVTGALVPGAKLSTAALFAMPPRAVPVDARIIYDQGSSRWLACAADIGPSEDVFFAYSPAGGSPLPLASWTARALNLPKSGDYPDSPTLGVDNNGVYISWLQSHLSDGSIDENMTVCLPKPAVYNGSTIQFPLTSGNDKSDFTWKVQPAVNLDSPPVGGYAWCIAKAKPDNPKYQQAKIWYRRIQWDQVPSAAWAGDWQALSVNGETPYFDFDNDPTGTYGAPQLGGTLRVNFGRQGSRLHMAVIRNGYLWTCQHVGLDNPGGTYSGSTVDRSGIQWWRLQVFSTGLTDAGHSIVFDNASIGPVWFYMPSLAVNCANAIVLGYSGSSGSTYINAYYTARMADGTIPAQSVVIQNGNSYNQYAGPPRGWGDYSFTTVDPVDNQTFWTVQCFAAATDNGLNWSDWVVSLIP